MATSTIKTRKANSKVLLDEIIDVTSGATISLSDNYSNYTNVGFVFGTDSTVSSSSRGAIVIPTNFLQYDAYYPLVAGSNAGWVRIGRSGSQIRIISTSFSALYLRTVFGYM